ncbi:hypothetical protein EDD68_11452 [Melghiribacillus thermohalophilus]|uniref:Uncharacterized protein n=1 Tax=Melghiribacillus thermohalophilus TaxID=1324956 RepID=A0A4R3MV35_9BACI|nr:hypothetical protein [Melghiribacillus thermohalophilus]TCT20368.1 hypothetical protein EDD68_11452 [Melghiribacillus thermohalophilus]
MKMVEPYELVQVKHPDGKKYEFFFHRSRFPTGKKNVLSKVTELKDGTLSGYIYVGHLPEYDHHPKRTKMGYLPIKHFTADQLEKLLKKVTERCHTYM